MKLLKRFFSLIFFIVLLFSVSGLKAQDVQDDSAALAAADTSGFTINNSNSWYLFNSYVAAYKTDSVQLELIVMHANTLAWEQEQYIGKIKAQNLRPQITQTIPFSLITVQFSIRIDTQGRCYLKKLSGSLPEEENIAVPFKIYYRK